MPLYDLYDLHAAAAKLSISNVKRGQFETETKTND